MYTVSTFKGITNFTSSILGSSWNVKTSVTEALKWPVDNELERMQKDQVNA